MGKKNLEKSSFKLSKSLLTYRREFSSIKFQKFKKVFKVFSCICNKFLLKFQMTMSSPVNSRSLMQFYSSCAKTFHNLKMFLLHNGFVFDQLYEFQNVAETSNLQFMIRSLSPRSENILISFDALKFEKITQSINDFLIGISEPNLWIKQETPIRIYSQRKGNRTFSIKESCNITFVQFNSSLTKKSVNLFKDGD